jgi:hypothetical protein
MRDITALGGLTFLIFLTILFVLALITAGGEAAILALTAAGAKISLS